MTQPSELELRNHLNTEATVRLVNIFKMLQQLATHDEGRTDASRLSDIRKFLGSAILSLETKLEKGNGPADPGARSPEGDQPDLQRSADA